MSWRVKHVEHACAYETCFAGRLFPAGIARHLLPQKRLFQTVRRKKIVSEPITFRSLHIVLQQILNHIGRIFVVG